MAAKPGKTVVFRMNGVCNAFIREIGCHSCPQCSADKPRAQTSGSLVVKSSWKNRRQTEYHVLFDCGIGVVDSLIDFGISTVSHIFVSHNHLDHIAGLDRLVNGQKRSGGPVPLDVYCTQGTWDEGPHRLYPWLSLNHKLVAPAKTDRLSLGIDLRITPAAVYHGRFASEPVIWIVEFGSESDNTHHKIVLGWDLLHLVPRYSSEDKDAHYAGTTVSSTVLVSPHDALFQDVDELFLAGNTITPQDTGHMSIETALSFLIPSIQPKRTWIVHYSGHEDSFGPLSDEQLQDWLNKNKRAYGLDNHDILVAQHGMTLVYNV